VKVCVFREDRVLDDRVTPTTWWASCLNTDYVETRQTGGSERRSRYILVTWDKNFEDRVFPARSEFSNKAKTENSEPCIGDMADILCGDKGLSVGQAGITE
jgi:hypothetical protein